MLKRISGVIFSAFIGMALFSVSAHAFGQVEYWGSIEPKFNHYIYAYEIYTAEELQYISGYSGSRNIVLCSDINLSGKKWHAGSFRGILDGQGHTISGLDSDKDCLFSFANSGSSTTTTISNLTINISGALSPVSLVDENQENMTITNCQMTGSVIMQLDDREWEPSHTSDTIQYGAIAKENSGTIKDCNSYVNISISCNKPRRLDDEIGHGQIYLTVGGVVGDNRGSVENCSNYGNVVVDTSYDTDSESGIYVCLSEANMGGIVGIISDANGVVSGCYNAGKLYYETGGAVAGGIVGSCRHRNGSVTISNCTNNGEMIIGHGEVGGIISGYDTSYGQHETSIAIDRCTNKANIKVNEGNTSNVAGIVAWCSEPCSIAVTNCTNEGNVTARWSASGIADSLGTKAQVLGCINKGSVQGGYDATGIIRYNEGDVEDCYNLATITTVGVETCSDSSGCSGIVSTNSETGSIINCGNSGNVINNGAGDVAGITELNCGIISKSYNTGFIYGAGIRYGDVAGIACRNESAGVISNCFVKDANIEAGATHSGYLSGICCTNLGTISDCYFQGILSSSSAQDIISTICTMFKNDGMATTKACYSVATVNSLSDNDEVYGLLNYGNTNTAVACYSNISGVDSYDEGAIQMTLNELSSSSFPVTLDTLSGQVNARGVWKNGTLYPELTGIEAPYTQPTVDSSSFGDYYSTLTKRTIRVFLQDISYASDGPIVTASLENIGGVLGGEWNGTTSDIVMEIPIDYDGDIRLSCEGYLSKTLPAELVGNFNTVKLWKTSESGRPVLQSALLDKTKNGYKAFSDLASGAATLPIYENSSDMYSIYIDVDWGTCENHSIKLMQGTEEIVLLNEGWNRNLMLGRQLKHSGGAVYINMGDGAATKGIFVKVYEEKPIHISMETGDTQEATMPENVDAIGGTKLKIDLKELTGKVIPMKLEVSDDGTVKGTIGLALDQPGGIGHSNWAFGTLKNAFKSWKNNTPSDQEVNNLIKELNKYGVPHSKSGHFGIKVELQVLGYCEGKFDFTTGQVHFEECGIITVVGGKVSYTQQATLPVIPVPIYFEAGMSLKANLTFPMELIDNHLTGKDESFKVELAITGGAGFGVPKAVTGGVRGKGELSVSSRFPYDSNDAEWTLSATGSFVGYIFGLDGEWEVWNTPSWIIYKNGEWFPGGNAAQLLYISSDEFSMASRSYLDNESEFFANESISMYTVDDNAPTSLIKSNIYTYASPQIVIFPDNTKLLVWVDDAGIISRPLSSNRTALFYSYFNGSDWTPPAFVCEDNGKADFNPILKCIDGTAHLVWNEADILFESDDVTLTEVSLAMGISYAQFDQSSQSFVNKSSLTDIGDGADFLPDIALVNDVPTVVWVNNSVGDYFLSNGASTLKKAELTETGWIVENLNADISGADSIAVQNVDGNLAVYYSKDTNGDILSQSDREIFCYENYSERQITSNEVSDSKPIYTAKGTMWYQGGSLVLNGENIASVAGDDYQYVAGPQGRAAVLYCEHTQNTSSLYAIYNDGAGWSNKVALTETQGFIYAYSGSFSSDGSLSVAVTQWENDKTANLVMYDVLPTCDISVPYADYDMYTLISGKTLNMTVNIKNTGMATVSAINVSVQNYENEIYRDSLGVYIRPGEEVLVDIPCALPDDLPSALKIEISPIGVADSNIENNSFDCQLRTSDISIEHLSAATTEEKTVAIVQLANRGVTELTNLNIKAYLDSNSGTELWTNTVGSIPPGGSVNLPFEIEDILSPGELIYVMVEPVENENIINNNELFCVVQDLREPTYILGDVNEDGEIDLSDVMDVINHSVGNSLLTGNALLAADVNKDGSIDLDDVMMLINYSVGNITAF